MPNVVPLILEVPNGEVPNGEVVFVFGGLLKMVFPSKLVFPKMLVLLYGGWGLLDRVYYFLVKVEFWADYYLIFMIGVYVLVLI